MFKADFDIVQEGHYRHSQHDTSFDNEDLSKKMQKLYANLFYLKHELNHLTKSECLSKLVKTYNILSELYDIIDYDYTEDPQKTSRLGFAKLPQKTKHRDEIDDLMIEIRVNIQELNHQSWSRDGVKTVIRKMLEVYEYEQRELDSLKPFAERIRSTGVDKVSHKLAKMLMDSSVETVYDEIIQEEKLSTDDRKELKDKQFGIPSLRKYPLTDEKHVLQAVRFFSKAPEEYKEELARNIVKRAKQLGMDWTKWESIKPYLHDDDEGEQVQESSKDIIPKQTTHPDANKNDKIKYVSNFKYDKVYFGTPNPYPDGIDCDRPLFVTPFKSLACIFAVSKNMKELGVPRGSYNKHYTEWAHPKDEYIDEIHMQVEGCNDETEHVVKMHGYVYEVDVSDLKDHIGRYDWMTPQLEYLICDQDHIDWSNQKKVDVTVHWTGQKSNNPKYHQEAFIMESDEEKSLKQIKKTCEELVKHLVDFKYGIPRKDGKIHHIKNSKDYEKNYHLLSPEEFVKYGGGVCWDFVEYEEKWLKDRGIDCRKFYIITETPPNYDTHTFVVVTVGGKHIWVESSFKKLAGVHLFSDLRELAKTITYAMFKLNGNKHRWHQFKYSMMEFTGKHPDYGSTNDEYMDWMAENAKLQFDDVAKQNQPYDLNGKVTQEAAVPVDQLKQMVGEVYQQALQVKYGCLDEDGERITASPFQDSWKMIVDYHSQSIESIEESKLGVCFEHSFYVADLLKKKNLPYQTFFLNCNVLNEDDPSSQITFWHQFTIVPNDTDSVVLIETSLTPEKNGVFLVKDMEDAVQHLINSFNINIPQESIEFMKQDLIDVSDMEPRDGDTYLGYIDLVYQNGKLIKDEIRIKHRNEMMKIYWDYMKEHNYLSYDGDKVYEQIKDFNPDTSFELYSISRVYQLFTDKGNKFNQDIGVLEPTTFFSLTPKEMESKLKGFVQESYMEDHHDNKLKSKFRYVPLTPKSAKKYASQGSFKYGLERTRVNKDTHGAIYITDSDIVVGYVAIEKKANGERWITALEVSTEYQGHGYGVDLLQISVDEFKADHLSVNKKNEQAFNMYLRYGWTVYDTSDHMYFMKLKDGDDNDE